MRRCVLAGLTAIVVASCARRAAPPALDLSAAAESYVRIVLALGERDEDSLDSYRGPRAWRREAREQHAALVDIQRDARALADRLSSQRQGAGTEDDVRRAFLRRQLEAVVARIDILRGARPRFAEETARLFGLNAVGDPIAIPQVHAAIARELPGSGPLGPRYAAFDRRFLIPADRLERVMMKAIEGCRGRTLAHVRLPDGDRVDVRFVGDMPWSALTRYEGAFHSTVRINTSLPLTVDRALDLACHETYPGHHTIDTLLETQASERVELQVKATFSPQSLLQESASSVAGMLAFSDEERVAFEAEALFPLAGLDPAGAAPHVRVSRLVDRLHGVEADVARRYLDGQLDFARASAVLERDALMPSADATLKYLNQFRSYAATYTIGRDLFWRRLSAAATNQDNLMTSRWHTFVGLATNSSQVLQ